jgi:uncharacterized membrane protein
LEDLAVTLIQTQWSGATSDSTGARPGDDQNLMARRQHDINVGGDERIVSMAAGSILAVLGLSRQSLPGLLVAAVGGSLIYRGASGHCHMYRALGIDTAHGGQAQPTDYFENGIHVEQAFTINQPAHDLYAFWHDFENLPRIMTHLRSVTVLGDRRSHWVANAPGIAGGKVEWDAEIINDEPDTVIAWRSLPGADVDNAGSVRFAPALGDRGTEVRVVLDYIPPAGRVGKWVAKLFGEEPAQQIREDLRRFKRFVEVGEIPTTDGQPRGTCTGRGKRQYE